MVLILVLKEEIADLDELIAALVARINPLLMEASCIGVEIAAQLLITAGENPERMKSEAAFAMLSPCSVVPLPCPPPRARPVATGLTAAETGPRTARCTWLP